jgi:hypothetical protein
MMCVRVSQWFLGFLMLEKPIVMLEKGYICLGRCRPSYVDHGQSGSSGVRQPWRQRSDLESHQACAEYRVPLTFFSKSADFMPRGSPGAYGRRSCCHVSRCHVTMSRSLVMRYTPHWDLCFWTFPVVSRSFQKLLLCSVPFCMFLWTPMSFHMLPKRS